MSRCILLLFLFALPAVAQKNMYEEKVRGGVVVWTSATSPTEPWTTEGNGGAEFTSLLNQPVDCTRCIHGHLHEVDFGGGPFLIDDEGYVFSLFREPVNPQAIRDFANGVH